MAPVSPRVGTMAWSRWFCQPAWRRPGSSNEVLTRQRGGSMGQQASPHPIPQGFDLRGALMHQRVLPAERDQAIKCLLGALEGRSRLRMLPQVTGNLTHGQPGLARNPVEIIDPFDRRIGPVG